MADIFLSYSRDDQATARRFAEGFEREGFSVWWDATLHSGEAYDQVTEKALREARAVVVLWSNKSVDSRWVRAEATTADRNGTLVPVMIEACTRPIMFELTHTADLSHWKGDLNDKAWKAYVADVHRFVQREHANPRVPQPAAPAQQGRSLSAKSIAIPLAAILVTGAVAVTFLLLRDRPVAASAATDSTAATASASAASAVSVAVMPFANLTGDPTKDYLGDGLAEELINALTKVPGLTVPSRTSSFAYRGRNVDLKQIAKDLDVGTILEGSVRSDGTAIRVTAQLIDAQTDRHLWSQTYDRKLTDLFKLQDDLAHEIVTAFKRTMNADLPEFESAGPPTQDPEAYALYLQGTAQVNRNSEASLRNAIAAFEQAIARDPQFGEAYLGMASAHFLYGSPLADVESNARRAVEIRPALENPARRLLAGVAAKRGRWIEAEEVFRSLPRGVDSPGFYADHAISTLWPTGQLKRSLSAYGEAYRRAPGAGSLILINGMANSALGRNEEAIRFVNAAIAAGVDPVGRRTLQVYAEVAAREGRFDDAAERMTGALSETARAAGGEAVIKAVYAGLGDPARRPAAIDALRAYTPRVGPADWVVKVWGMGWFTQLGALDDAYRLAEELRRQFAEQSPTNAWSWLWSPELREFRRDPRFHDLTGRLGMTEYWKKYGPPDDCDLGNGKLVCS